MRLLHSYPPEWNARTSEEIKTRDIGRNACSNPIGWFTFGPLDSKLLAKGGPGHDVFGGEGVDRVVDFNLNEDTANTNCALLGEDMS